MIVPPILIDTIAEVKDKLNLHTPFIIQKALSQYILDGQLERHIHKMKKVYKKRRNFMTERLQHLFGNDISILGDEAQACIFRSLFIRKRTLFFLGMIRLHTASRLKRFRNTGLPSRTPPLQPVLY